MSRRLYFRAVAACAVVVSTSVVCFAATKAERTRAAKELVQEALHREIYGLQGERDELLRKAADQLPDFAPAWWHRGYVRHNNQWVKAKELPDLLANQQRIANYRHVREQYDSTINGRMALADWCKKRGLEQQERAHLSEVITLNPDHAGARARLDFTRVDDRWIPKSEAVETNLQLRQRENDLRRWRPRIEEIARGLGQPALIHRQAATKRLMAITDSHAAPAIETVLGGRSEATALLMVQALGQLSSDSVSLTLARQAIISPFSKVRDAAARQLRDRDSDGFIPVVLSMMHTPVTSSTQVLRAPSGQLFFRQTFTRENVERREQLVVDSITRRSALPDPARLQAVNNILTNDDQADLITDPDVVRQNRVAEWMNGRITAALNIVTEQQLAADPESWWKWWNEANEVFLQGDKPMATRRHVQRADVGQLVRLDRADGLVPPSGPRPILPSRSESPSPPRRSDCLAAGTVVWTDAGPKAIEAMRVGDLVLSQDPQTGELAFKPVLQTTVRPQGALVRVELASGEEFQTSGGHLFWVAGEGWTKSRDLQSGMEIHGVDGVMRVSSIGDGPDLETYNLVVADFNSYFVGRARVLSHDNTVRQPTNAIVPGLIQN